MGGVGDFFSGVGDFLFGEDAGARAESKPVADPALLGTSQIQNVIQRILNLTGRPTPASVSVGPQASPFFGAFQSAISDRFTPTAPERQLLEDISGATSAQFSRRGLGASPIAATSVASSIAPALIQLRQQRINNLSNAIGQDLSGQQLGLTQRGQNIGAGAANVSNLINFLQFGRRQPVGQFSQGAQTPFLPQFSNFLGNVGSLKGGGGGGGKPF